ncbi:thiamine phosphate synthase [Sphingobacterium sp. LRF_L2]|uniref:thiamine phosphate synthase n=1 Tax=Sphingobacterium sp. LRF_L2 TaxID=3369421 RepID=UPI003F602EB1
MHVITLPTPHKNELSILRTLVQWEDISIHIRKPFFTALELADFIAPFSTFERQRFILHADRKLAIELGISRIHLSGLHKQSLNKKYHLEKYASTSSHSWSEFNQLPDLFESAFVSPVFPSFSKPGYGLERKIGINGRRKYSIRAIALGGVNSLRLKHLKGYNFDDFALCGALWESTSPLAEAEACHALQHLFDKHDKS